MERPGSVWLLEEFDEERGRYRPALVAWSPEEALLYAASKGQLPATHPLGPLPRVRYSELPVIQPT